MLLHFTREAFFCLTGFVLVHQNLAAGPSARHLLARAVRRRRRAVPGLVGDLRVRPATARVGAATLRHLSGQPGLGTAWYHLYFLLVSMQIYLLFPVIAGWSDDTPAITRLLAVSAAGPVALLTVLDVRPADDGLGRATSHQRTRTPAASYQFYVLVGAVAAFHLDDGSPSSAGTARPSCRLRRRRRRPPSLVLRGRGTPDAAGRRRRRAAAGDAAVVAGRGRRAVPARHVWSDQRRTPAAGSTARSARAPTARSASSSSTR